MIKRYPRKHKSKFYEMVIKLTLFNWGEILESRTLMFRKCKFHKWRILIWMCIHARRDKIRNEDTRKKWGDLYIRQDKGSEHEIAIWAYESNRCRCPMRD